MYPSLIAIRTPLFIQRFDNHRRPQRRGVMQIVQDRRHRVVCKGNPVRDHRAPHDLGWDRTVSVEVTMQPSTSRRIDVVTCDVVGFADVREPLVEV